MRSFEAKDDIDDKTKSRVYIGEKCVVRGDISATEIVVSGFLEGNIQAARLYVLASGRFEGNVVVTDADIHGFVLGNMEIKQSLTIHDTGHIAGAVSYGDLRVEKGAAISAEFSPADIHAPKAMMKNHPLNEMPSSPDATTHKSRTATPALPENDMTKFFAADL